MNAQARSQKQKVRRRQSGARSLVNRAIRAFFFLTSVFCLLPSSYAGTHVTASYDLGQNPRVMATVNGTPEYGLVFVQRNKQVTYNGVEYGPSVIKGYLDVSGQLNDGAGNLWLDLVPNANAAPADSFYVVTINIQGSVHSEIWVVPDVPTVGAEVCRQAQPPSSIGPPVFYQFLQLAGADLTQRPKLNFSGSGVSCADNAGQLRTDCAFPGGGSAPLASATTSGTVKTDVTAADPVVYLKSTTDTLLAGKVPATRTISTTAPLEGGGALSADLTLSLPAAGASQNGYLASTDWTTFNGKENPLTFNSPLSRNVNTVSCPTCEVTGNKNAASGYAGLTASTKLTAAQGQEVWSIADLTDYTGTSGSGSTAIKATITSPQAADVLTYSGGNWINQAPGGGTAHNFLSATHSDTVAASPVLGDLPYANATSAWTKLAGNTTTTKKWLNQTGNGSVSAAPIWDILAAADIPSLDVAKITSGTFAAARGGTNNAYFQVSGPATSAKTFTFPNADATIEYQANKNAASGYAGLNASSQVASLNGGTENSYFAVTGPATAKRTFTFPNADATVEVQANKNAASGYAGLDSGSRIAKAQAPSTTVYTDAASTYTAGQKQTFQNSATTAGLNLASSADPSGPAQGDVWLATEALKWRGAATTYSVTPQSRNVSTSSPLGGGGALTADLSLTCSTCEVTGNKNGANGYAGLDAGTKLSASQLPNPGATTLGGVKSLTCSGTDKLSAIGTDGLPVCSTDQTGGAGGGYSNVAGDSGTAAKTGTEALKFLGTANEIATVAADGSPDDSVTFSLPAQLNFSGKEIIGGALPFKFEGATDNNIYWKLSITDPTIADKTTTVPNADTVLPQAFTCTNQVATALSGSTGATTCSPLTLASAQFANQGTTTTVPHGNASGNPSWGSVVVADVAAVLKTRQIGFIIGADNASAALADADDQATIYANRLGQGITVTEVWCESDGGTPSINIYRDGTSPGNVLSSNLSCSISGATGTIDGAQDNLANGEKLDFVMATAGGTAKRVTVYIKYTLD